MAAVTARCGLAGRLLQKEMPVISDQVLSRDVALAIASERACVKEMFNNWLQMDG